MSLSEGFLHRSLMKGKNLSHLPGSVAIALASAAHRQIRHAIEEALHWGSKIAQGRLVLFVAPQHFHH